MAFLERLQILIDADAGGAVREFKKVGNTADRELGKATKSLDRMSSKLTSFGAGAVVGAAALGAGLAMFAKEASAAETQQLKLTNSIKNSTAAFPGNGKALRDQAAALMKVTVADDDAIVSAQALLVQFGRTSKETLALTPLVVDLSRKMGIDLDAAAKAVGKSSEGSSGALKKMGIEVVDLGGGASDTQNTIAALAGSVGSFAESEGQTFAGQLDIMKNKFGELKESIGKGVLDVVMPIASIGTALSDVNPVIGQTVGKVGTIGAASSLAVGGVSILAGQAIKLRGAFTTVTGEGAAATRSMTGFGKAAAGIGLVVGTAIVADLVFGVINSGKAADDTAKAFDDLRVALKGSGDGTNAVVQGFGELVNAEQNTLRLTNLWQEFGAEVSIVGGKAKADIEQVQRAFDNLGKEQGPQAQFKVLDALQSTNEELDHSSEQYKINKEFIDKNTRSLKSGVEANGGMVKSINGVTTALDYNETSMKSIDVTMKSYDAQLKFIAETQQMGATRAAAYGKAIEDSSALDDQATAAFGMNEAYKGLFNTLGDLPKEFDAVKAALGDYTDEQNSAVGAVIAFGEKAGSVLEQAVTSGGDPRFLGGIFRARLEETLKNANIPPEQIAEYIGLAGLSEQQIDVAVKLSIAEEERIKFTTFLALLNATGQQFPPEIIPKVNELATNGEFAKLNALILASQPGVTKTQLDFILGVYPDLAPAVADAQRQADANPIVIPSIIGAPAPPAGAPGRSRGDTRRGGNRRPANPVGPAGGGSTSTPPASNMGGSYSGGPASAGGRYEVNEGGREFFTPSSNGFIMNASDAAALLQGVSQLVSSGGGGRGMTNNFTINETSSPRQTALEVIRANKASLFLAGAL